MFAKNIAAISRINSADSCLGCFGSVNSKEVRGYLLGESACFELFWAEFTLYELYGEVSNVQ